MDTPANDGMEIGAMTVTRIEPLKCDTCTRHIAALSIAFPYKRPHKKGRAPVVRKHLCLSCAGPFIAKRLAAK